MEYLSRMRLVAKRRFDQLSIVTNEISDSFEIVELKQSEKIIMKEL